MSHALFSPSGAFRWTQCPGSLVLSKDIETKDNEASREGTMLHGVMQYHLQKLKSIQSFDLDDEQMAVCQECAKHVRGLQRQDTFYELKVCFNDYVNQPANECTGTSDVVMANGDTLRVLDYKFGRNYVDPQDNPQGILYMLGAVQTMAIAGYEFNNFEFEILQPRVGNNVSNGVYKLTKKELLVKAGEMKTACAKVKEAFALRSISPEYAWNDAFLNPSEDACRFCPCAATCPCMADMAAASVAEYSTMRDADNATLSQRYSQLPMLKEYIRALEEEVMARLMKKEAIPGYMLTKGREGNRKWKDEEEVNKEITTKYGVNPTETVLLSPAKLQNRLVANGIDKKEAKAVIDEMVVRAEGKPTVSPAKDGGVPWDPDEDLKKEFESI